MDAGTPWGTALAEHFGSRVQLQEHADGPALEVTAEHLSEVLRELRDAESFRFAQLIDLAGMDYAEFGQTEWKTSAATATGFRARWCRAPQAVCHLRSRMSRCLMSAASRWSITCCR